MDGCMNKGPCKASVLSADGTVSAFLRIDRVGVDENARAEQCSDPPS